MWNADFQFYALILGPLAAAKAFLITAPANYQMLQVASIGFKPKTPMPAPAGLLAHHLAHG